MNSLTRNFLEQLFGKDPLKFASPVVGVWRSKTHRRVSYKLDIPGFSPTRLIKTFWRLRQKDIIEYLEDSDNVRIVLTENGKKEVLSYKFDDLCIVKPKRWDNLWRMVAFDIPESKKKSRDALVQKMKDLGLIQFQKSLWIHPYECKNEIDFVSEIFGVGRYVHYMTISEMTNDNMVRQKFNLDRNINM